MLLFTLALNYAVSARNNWIDIDATSPSAVFPSTGATQMHRFTTNETARPPEFWNAEFQQSAIFRNGYKDIHVLFNWHSICDVKIPPGIYYLSIS